MNGIASINQIGKKFGLLTITEVCRINKKTFAYFICDCGNKKKGALSDILNGRIVGCGCSRKRPKTHGQSYHPLYIVYNGMIDRCYRSKNKQYKDYGGRGIIVSYKWKNNYMNFFNWSIANGYKHGLLLDRENNNGIYEPSNCRYVTRAIQNRNTRKTIIVEYNGEKMCLKDFSQMVNISYGTIKWRHENNKPLL